VHCNFCTLTFLIKLIQCNIFQVTFTLVHASTERPVSQGSAEETKLNLIPRVTGSRAALNVLLPVPEVVLALLPPPPGI